MELNLIVDKRMLSDIILPNMASVEGPQIFRSTESPDSFPSYLPRDPDGLIWIDNRFVVEGARRGPYEIVMDFGTSRAPRRDLVPEAQRLREDIDGLTVLAFQEPTIQQAMDTLSVLANDPNKSSDEPTSRQEYRDKLALVYQAMARKVIDWGGRDALILAPKKGGIFVQDVFEDAGLPKEIFFDYRMSRVQRRDGGLMLGVTFGKDNPEISKFRKFVIADDCMASEISIFGSLELIKGKLEEAKIPLSEVEILITTSAATQRGLESLLSQETGDYFGFSSVRTVVGTLVYEMDDHFYLRHPDGRFVVADMGDWTQPVPA